MQAIQVTLNLTLDEIIKIIKLRDCVEETEYLDYGSTIYDKILLQLNTDTDEIISLYQHIAEINPYSIPNQQIKLSKEVQNEDIQTL